jgi:hypothetical protein
MKTINVSERVFDYILTTLKFRKKRLLMYEPSKEFSPKMRVGSITVGLVKTDELRREIEDSIKKQRLEWEEKMARVEEAITFFENLV